ncbi:MAG: YchJ family metal-binding protein [Lentimicrobium sp.]|nr:YchJ family metal-binding protein [Lentimicrobium sp.]
MTKPCPCGSGRSFNDCCHRIISGKHDALTSEELMRSRYTAFTLADTGYLMLSQHSSTRRPGEAQSLKKWAQSVQWMGLVILNTYRGLPTDDTGYVEFRAFYTEAGSMQQIHEKSLFRRENGKWVYVSGVHF